MMKSRGAGTSVPSGKYGVGTSVPSNGIEKNGTKVPTPKGYKHTKVGVIPDDWECLPARNYFDKRIAKGYEGLETYSITIKKSWQKRSELNRETGTELSPDKSLLAEKGDLVYNTMRMWQGALGMAENSGVVSPAYIVLRPKSMIDSKFAFYMLKSYTYLHYLTAYSYGLTSDRLRLYFKDFGMIPFICPPLEEQEKIVQILAIWDDAISKQETLTEAKEELKKGLMQKLLSGEVRFDGFDGEWEEINLKEICQIKKGIQLNKSNMTEIGEYPAINGGIKPSGYTNEWNTKANTITISEGGNSCGYVNFLTEKFWSGGHCYALQNLKVDTLFLYQFLKLNEISIMRLRVGSGLPNIQKGDIEKFRIQLPSVEEQQKIAQVLTLTDKEIDLLKNELEALKEQKRGLMQRLLSGEVRVVV